MRSALKMRTALRTAPKPTDAATAAIGGAHASAARESESVALPKVSKTGRRDGACHSRLLVSLRRDSFRRSSEFECAEYETTTPTYLFHSPDKKPSQHCRGPTAAVRAVQRRQQS
jgi:hypothetical protein